MWGPRARRALALWLLSGAAVSCALVVGIDDRERASGVGGGAAVGAAGGGGSGAAGGGSCAAEPACKSGRRAGLCDELNVAACEGSWSGKPADAELCAAGWHVCTSADGAYLRNHVSYQEATAMPGCFAIDATTTASQCRPCDPSSGESNERMLAGVGHGCTVMYPGPGGGCVGGGEIDVPDIYSGNDNLACMFHPGLTSGVACCRDVECSEGMVNEPCDAPPLVTTCRSGPGDGCADGSRDGLCDHVNIAACAGAWSGPVAGATLCQAGWHPCASSDLVIHSVAIDEALSIDGCFAIDAAASDTTCQPCVVGGAADLAAIGNGCGFVNRADSGCLETGRVVVKLGSECSAVLGVTTGVACCVN
jgi:hypothetical protein